MALLLPQYTAESRWKQYNKTKLKIINNKVYYSLFSFFF